MNQSRTQAAPALPCALYPMSIILCIDWFFHEKACPREQPTSLSSCCCFWVDGRGVDLAGLLDHGGLHSGVKSRKNVAIKNADTYIQRVILRGIYYALILFKMWIIRWWLHDAFRDKKFYFSIILMYRRHCMAPLAWFLGVVLLSCLKAIFEAFEIKWHLGYSLIESVDELKTCLLSAFWRCYEHYFTDLKQDGLIISFFR